MEMSKRGKRRSKRLRCEYRCSCSTAQIWPACISQPNDIFFTSRPKMGFPAPWHCPQQQETPAGILILQTFGPWPFSPPPAPGCQVAQSRVFLLVIAPACKVTATAGKQPDLPDEGLPSSSSSLRPTRRRWESWMVAGSGNKRRKIIRDGGSPVCFQRAGNRLVFYPAHLLRICP